VALPYGAPAGPDQRPAEAVDGGEDEGGDVIRDGRRPVPDSTPVRPQGGSMPNIGPMEIGIVLIIALIVFGPKKLPELGNSLGKGIREFKGSLGAGDHDREDERTS
jgi:sec-independent protein translocase protein TatA